MSFIALVGQLRLRLENSDEIALRLAAYFERLAELNVLFRGWRRIGNRHRSTVPAAVTLLPDEAELRSWVDESAIFRSCSGRKQRVGHAIRAMTSDEKAVYADFWLRTDSSPFPPQPLNCMGLTLMFREGGRSTCDDRVAVPKHLIAVLRGALLASARAWDCDWAAVAPGDFRWDSERPTHVPLDRYQSGWMVYLDPGLAACIPEPENIAVETFHDGAVLLTAVTDAQFHCRDPIHRAAALRIQAALAPLNQAERARASE